MDAILNGLKGVIGKLNSDIIFYIAVGLLALVFVLGVVTALIKSYGLKFRGTSGKVIKFLESPQDPNGINAQMKAMPENVKDCWRAYLNNRKGKPSDYFSSTVCVDTPLKTSWLPAFFKIMLVLTPVMALFAYALLAFKAAGDYATAFVVTPHTLVATLLVALIGVIFAVLFIIFDKVGYNGTLKKYNKLCAALDTKFAQNSGATMPEAAGYAAAGRVAEAEVMQAQAEDLDDSQPEVIEAQPYEMQDESVAVQSATEAFGKSDVDRELEEEIRLEKEKMAQVTSAQAAAAAAAQEQVRAAQAAQAAAQAQADSAEQAAIAAQKQQQGMLTAQLAAQKQANDALAAQAAKAEQEAKLAQMRAAQAAQAAAPVVTPPPAAPIITPPPAAPAAASSGNSVDDVCNRILVISKGGATVTEMKEVAVKLQQERAKPENKIPVMQKRLNEALAMLLKAMQARP